LVEIKTSRNQPVLAKDVIAYDSPSGWNLCFRPFIKQFRNPGLTPGQKHPKAATIAVVRWYKFNITVIA
jgi:hypothetical protein